MEGFVAVFEFYNGLSIHGAHFIYFVQYAQPTISQHLKELKSIGLIKGEIDGKKVCYCIDLETWDSIQQKLDGFFDSTRINCC